MAGSDFRPVYHPAGHDNELRVAVQDLRTGRWVSMAQLLDRTDGWGLWTQRTQVLAAVAMRLGRGPGLARRGTAQRRRVRHAHPCPRRTGRPCPPRTAPAHARAVAGGVGGLP